MDGSGDGDPDGANVGTPDGEVDGDVVREGGWQRRDPEPVNPVSYQ